jgi:hypothetical protein
LPNKFERTRDSLVTGLEFSLRLAVDMSNRETLALHPAAKRAHAAPKPIIERRIKENG